MPGHLANSDVSDCTASHGNAAISILSIMAALTMSAYRRAASFHTSQASKFRKQSTGMLLQWLSQWSQHLFPANISSRRGYLEMGDPTLCVEGILDRFDLLYVEGLAITI